MSAALPEERNRLAARAGCGPLAGLPAAGPERLRVHVVAAGPRRLVRVSGPVEQATVPALEEALRRTALLAPDRGGHWLILDLRSVDYIETPGLRLLLALTDERSPSSGRVCLVVQPHSRVERTLRLAGLDQRSPLVPTVREAWTGRRAAEAGRARPAGEGGAGDDAC